MADKQNKPNFLDMINQPFLKEKGKNVIRTDKLRHPNNFANPKTGKLLEQKKLKKGLDPATLLK